MWGKYNRVLMSGTDGSFVTVLLTGDALVTRPLNLDPNGDLADLSTLCDVADICFTNLEAPLNGYVGTPVPGESIHLSTRPEIGQNLIHLGFNLFATANNHALDYGVEGLRQQLAAMDALGMVHAGIGETLADASRPTYLHTPKGRVALVACTASLGGGWIAADPGHGVAGRPGVNALRFGTTYRLDRERFEQLRAVAEALGLDRLEAWHAAMGHSSPLERPEQQMRFTGGLFERAASPGVTSAPHPEDLERNLTSVREARTQADLVVVSVHAHEFDTALDAPPDFLKVFARACIDAGADIVTGSGPHLLRGIELYQGKPIFYSLGNTWFEYETLERLPNDAYLSNNLDPFMSKPSDHADKALVGLREDARYWESVVPFCTFEGGALTEVTLYPIALGRDAPRPRRGQPSRAYGDAAEQVLRRLAELSEPFETEIELAATTGRIKI